MNDQVEQPPGGKTDEPATQQGPYNAPFAVNISFPESVVIRMVDATALNDYEFGLFITSLFASAFVGFLVAAFQVEAALVRMFIAVTVICLICAAAFMFWSLGKRKKMKARSRAFRLKTSQVDEIKDA